MSLNFTCPLVQYATHPPLQSSHFEEKPMAEILVLGLGNALQSDDGVGVKVVETLLQKYEFSDEVAILDGGTRGMALVACLEKVRKLLVVDAVAWGKNPGELTKLESSEVLNFLGQRVFSHEDGLAELLTAARFIEVYPEEVVLWGVEPAVLDVGEELSPPVVVCVDGLVDKVLAELRRWGVEGRLKSFGHRDPDTILV
jgi:hydrogenase maturation protease